MVNRKVIVEAGELQGIFGYDPRVTVFKGVPYAKPPVGDLRWRAPQPMDKWDGVYMADHYGPMACQITPGEDPADFWSKEIHPTGTEFEMSEDCLYLNIFTPAKKGDENLPVLFYIHGGGYQGGYPYEVEFDWEHMAKKGIVVVAVAYRLGILGFLATPELSAEAPDEPKGNYGILDQLYALKWVKRNIKAFGGNPDKITIAGQSAGAGSVQCLLTSSMAKGLIAGAIIESSVAADFVDSGKKDTSLKHAEETGKKFFEKAGINSMEEARKMEGRELIKLSNELLGPGFHFEPTIDGILLTETAFEAYLHNHHHNVPVLAGYNRGETEMFAAIFGSIPGNLKELDTYADAFGEKKAEFLQLCDVKEDKEIKPLFLSDAMVGIVSGTYMFGHLQSRQNRKTYLYEFNAEIPGDDNVGAYHGSEMWFAYDSLARCWRPFTGKHYDLARQISSYWVNFVKNGDVNGVDIFGNELQEWKMFTEEQPFVMEFTDKPEKSKNKESDLMKFRIEYTLREVRE